MHNLGQMLVWVVIESWIVRWPLVVHWTWIRCYRHANLRRHFYWPPHLVILISSNLLINLVSLQIGSLLCIEFLLSNTACSVLVWMRNARTSSNGWILRVLWAIVARIKAMRYRHVHSIRLDRVQSLSQSWICNFLGGTHVVIVSKLSCDGVER